jgi:L-threonylcarbamoyladenylate synthase
VNAWQARLAVRALRRGGLVLHATEGVWGLACDPWNPRAVERLLGVKGRPADKGLIVIGAASTCFASELAGLDAGARARIEASWPGPVTWTVPNRRFPPWITGARDTVAVRVPAHPQARALCRAFRGPLVSSSANRAGRPPARRRLAARALLQDLRRTGAVTARAADVYMLPGETLGRRGPSEIRTASGVPVRKAP